MRWREIWSVVKDIPGYYFENELYLLSECARRHEHIVEIGCEMGRSTVTIGLSMPEKGNLCLIDSFETYPDRPIREILLNNVKDIPPGWVLWETDSRSLTSSSWEGVTMAHIDGGHDAETVYGDMMLFAGMDGTMVLHDYERESLPGVTQAVDKFLDEKSWEIKNQIGAALEIGRSEEYYKRNEAAITH